MIKNISFSKLFLQLFCVSIFVCSILYLLNYIFLPDNSVFYNESGSYCQDIPNFELNIFNYDYQYVYPESCDQERYYSVFSNPANLISTEHPYQTRPIFVIFIYFINLLVGLFVGSNEIFSLQISNLIGHISILTFATSLILITFPKLSDLKLTEKLLFHSLILFSPLIKYALFDPSHQTLTYLNIAIMVYVLKNFESINFSKLSILLGFLFLAHRPFLLVFVVYFFYLTKLKINKKNIILGIKGSVYVLLPYIAYRYFILFLGYELYDGLTKKWGQFIWIFDFVRGRVRYESDWHCVTMPKNFECYFQDTSNALLYLLVPFLSVVILFLTKKLNSNLELIIFKSSIYYYLFWSLIGWYPPLRFNLYSLNYLLVLLLVIGYFKIEKNSEKLFLLTSNFLFFVSSSHWNNPNIINVDIKFILSIVLFTIYLIITLLSFFNKTSDEAT